VRLIKVTLLAIHDQVLLLLLLIFVPFSYYLSIHNRESVICILAYRPVNYWLCCCFYAVCLPKINEQITERVAKRRRLTADAAPGTSGTQVAQQHSTASRADAPGPSGFGTPNPELLAAITAAVTQALQAAAPTSQVPRPERPKCSLFQTRWPQGGLTPHHSLTQARTVNQAHRDITLFRTQ